MVKFFYCYRYLKEYEDKREATNNQIPTVGFICTGVWDRVVHCSDWDIYYTWWVN